jgi:hypothetical protein
MAATMTFVGLIANGISYTQTGGIGQSDATMGEVIVDVNITLSGNYGTASSHGDVLDFTAVHFPLSLGFQAPSNWEIKELIVAGVAPLGYLYNYCPGPTLAAPTQAGGVLQICGTGASSGQGGTELTEGSAYSSFTPSLSGAVLKARFWFARL